MFIDFVGYGYTIGYALLCALSLKPRNSPGIHIMLIDSSGDKPLPSHTTKVQLVLQVHCLYATIRLSLHFTLWLSTFLGLKTHDHDDYNISFRGGHACQPVISSEHLHSALPAVYHLSSA